MTPRPAPSPALIDRIMVVMEAAFDPAYGEAWNRRQVAEALTLSSTHALVVDANGTPIPDEGDCSDGPAPAGFVLTRYVLDEEELLLIAVMPGARARLVQAERSQFLAEEWPAVADRIALLDLDLADLMPEVEDRRNRAGFKSHAET